MLIKCIGNINSSVFLSFTGKCKISVFLVAQLIRHSTTKQTIQNLSRYKLVEKLYSNQKKLSLVCTRESYCFSSKEIHELRVNSKSILCIAK